MQSMHNPLREMDECHSDFSPQNTSDNSKSLTCFEEESTHRLHRPSAVTYDQSGHRESQPEPDPTPGSSEPWAPDNNYPEAIAKFQREITRARAEHEQFGQKFQSMIQRMQAMFELYPQNMDARNANFTQFVLEKDSHIQKLEAKIASLKEENQKLQDLSIGAQESALESMLKNSKWAPKEDQLVRDELSKLQERMRIWAKNYSVTRLNDLDGVSIREKDRILGELGGYCTESRWDSFLGKIKIPPNKVLAVLVQALLAKDVFQTIFANAFFGFYGVERGHSLPHPDEMGKLYKTMGQVHATESHIWRSQTLRILCSSGLLPGRTKRLGSICAEWFPTVPVSTILRQMTTQEELKQRDKELRCLYKSAADLALSLWTQRTTIRCLNLWDISTFTSDSLTTAHRLHHLDEDDARLNGKKILLYVQPGVVAFGNEDAEDYDKYKIWAPATVVVDGTV